MTIYTVILLFLVIVVLFGILPHGTYFYYTCEVNKEKQQVIPISSVDKILRVFTPQVTYEIEAYLNAVLKPGETVEIEIPINYEMSNKITMLSDEEEKELFKRLQQQMEQICFGADTSMNHLRNLYLVKEIKPKNNMKGPYNMLVVNLKRK